MKDTLLETVEHLSKSLADEIRSRRKAAGLTQAAVSRRAKVRVETISRIESGKANPTLETILRVVHATVPLTEK